MTTHTIIFTPSGQQTRGEAGETVYDVALRAGVDMQSICGGKGLCKRCQVEVEPGEFAKFKLSVGEDQIPKLSPTEKKARHDGELSDTRRLACRAKIRGDLVVEVPSDSRERETSIQKKSTHFETELNPAIQLHMVKLPEPTLEDNPSDTEALIKELADLGVTATFSHTLFQKLQPLLNQNDRTLICVVRDGAEVIDIWPPSEKQTYGAAIDVGSTSVAMYVYNLQTGLLVFEKAAMNPQIRYGEDLMSRVSYVMMNKGGEVKLTAEIRKQIASMLAAAIDELALSEDQLLEVICVGNPIMHHLLLGIDPTPLGVAPFTLTVKNWVDVPASYMEFGLSDKARVSLFPLIGGHVGADTTAAYLTQVDIMRDRSVLLVDIGTNAEIVLSHNGKIAAASSPTGPALEGAEISSGVRASLGAIERVRIDPVTKNGKVKIIGHDDWLSDEGDLGDHKITGICGSGIFEVMVELAAAGLIDQGGLFIPAAAPHRFEQVNNVWQYLLLDQPGNPIIVKQTDVRSVQLAKAALYAGAELLAEKLGCTEFDEVLLAGAFGTHLDSKYVADIHIVPHAGADKIRSIGNAAGTGAAMALLNVDEKAKIIAATEEVEKIETALEPKFQDYFVGSMKFPHAPASVGDPNRRRNRRRGG
ncbi:ASKHA domain-containing protein [Litorimonas sp. RW-G-Af-16]|uniref:ASKHA domain-containing protein n=1 Tax=Litorimonas sp. RW-G-Af-16 TaxID=3241168 RepID=UPI00390C788B